MKTTDQPKALLYRADLAAVERRVVESLPDILEALIRQAKEGDIRAATYLLDRALGRPVAMKTAPGDDVALPFGEKQFQEAAQFRDLKESILAQLDHDDE